MSQEFQTFDHFYTREALLMTTGSQMTWQVKGGTNFWQDYADKYSIEWKVEPLNDESRNCLSIQTSREQVTVLTLVFSAMLSVTNLLTWPRAASST